MEIHQEKYKMEKFWRRPSIIGFLITTFLASVPVIYESCTNSKYAGLTIALTVLWIGGFVVTFLLQEEIAGEIEAKQSAMLTSITRQLDIEKYILDDARAEKAFDALCRLYKQAVGAPPFVRKSLDVDIEVYLNRLIARFIHDNPKRYSKENEYLRVEELAEIISTSRESVLAVTVDGDDYLVKLWGAPLELMSKYVQVNVEKKDIVRRILILGKDVIEDKTSEKFKIVSRVYDLHQNNNIPIKVLIKEELLGLARVPDFGFLVSDDVITSKSYSHSNPAIPGEIKFYDVETARELRACFETLYLLSGVNWADIRLEK